MTKKRFTLSDEGIIDNVTKKEYNKISSNDGIYNSICCGDLFTLVNWLNKTDNQINLLKVLNKTIRKENEQLRILLKEAEDEIETLKKSNQCSMEALANKISKRVAEEPEVKECSFCGEFRTEYHEEDCCGNWSAEDFCNAGHDLEDTDPNSCKDYWDNF